ncbi:MAG: hypothetical protein H6737_23550 [Alphaproteobacteria bacterium]|nr:hypothetical protein [Alphaproteobacteria bacterium]
MARGSGLVAVTVGVLGLVGCANDPDGRLKVTVLSGSIETNGVTSDLTGSMRCTSTDTASDAWDCGSLGSTSPGGELPDIDFGLYPSVLAAIYETGGSQLLSYSEMAQVDYAIESGVSPDDIYRFVDPNLTRPADGTLMRAEIDFRLPDRSWQPVDRLTWVQQIETCAPLVSDGELSSCEVAWNGTFWDSGISSGGPERLVFLTTQLEITGMLPPEEGGGGPGDCFVGTWDSPAGCNGESATLTLGADGTGEVTSVDCSGTCATSSNVLFFTWTESGGTLTLNVSNGLTCGQPNPVTLTEDIAASCEGDTLLVNGEPYTRR